MKTFRSRFRAVQGFAIHRQKNRRPACSLVSALALPEGQAEGRPRPDTQADVPAELHFTNV